MGKYRNLKLETSPVLRALLANRKEEFVCEGTTRSGKTYGAADYINIQCQMVKKPIVVRSFRKTMADCKNTVGASYRSIMRNNYPEIWDGGKIYNKTEGVATYPSGSEYHFNGCDPERLPGYEQDIAHLEECTEIDYDSYMQIAMRTKYLMIYTFNPCVMDHWIFNVVMQQDTKHYGYNHSTYKDNEHLTPKIIRSIEKTEPTEENIAAGTADRWYWEVYGLGRRCRRQGAIYENWEKVDFFPDRASCQYWVYGLDWGFQPHPGAMILVAIANGFLYIKEIYYERELTVTRNPTAPHQACIQDKLEYFKILKSDPIICDSANPTGLRELQNLGYNAIAAHKPPGSVESGIMRVRTFPIRIYASSQMMLIEAENYVRDQKTGKPVKEYDHGWDCVRYAVSWVMDNNEIFINPKEEKPEYDIATMDFPNEFMYQAG